MKTAPCDRKGRERPPKPWSRPWTESHEPCRRGFHPAPGREPPPAQGPRGPSACGACSLRAPALHPGWCSWSPEPGAPHALPRPQSLCAVFPHASRRGSVVRRRQLPCHLKSQPAVRENASGTMCVLLLFWVLQSSTQPYSQTTGSNNS